MKEIVERLQLFNIFGFFDKLSQHQELINQQAKYIKQLEMNQHLIMNELENLKRRWSEEDNLRYTNIVHNIIYKLILNYKKN